MVSALSSANLAVDSSGRVTLGTGTSGIDIKGTVDAIMAAKRIPVDRLEASVSKNAEKLTKLNEMRGLVQSLQNAVGNLRGAVSLDGSGNIFRNRSTFASTTRVVGGLPTAAGSLLGVTVSNAASLGSHEIEIKQTARAHKIASSAFASVTSSLGISGSFTIEGKSISVSATDSLGDLRDRINNANSGTSPTGVTASIVSATPTQNYLVLTKDEAGTNMTVTDAGTVLSGLGMSSNHGTTYSNVLQAAQMAQFYADGLLDLTNETYESTVQIGVDGQLGSNGTIRFNDGVTTLDLAYTTTSTLEDLADSINANVTLQGMGISASLVQEGAGYRLKIDTSGTAFTMTETGGGSALTSLGIDNSRLLLERNSNTISDLFAGTTLTLYQAEPGTTIRLDIERDLSAVKTGITSFVEAYNALRMFVNTENQTDSATGLKGDVSGPLFGNPVMNDIRARLANIIGLGTTGVSTDFSALAQIGVALVNNNTLDDVLKKDTLEINSTKLDSVLLSNPEDVRRLFSFDFSSTDPNLVLLGWSSNTRYSATGYSLNIGTLGERQKESVSVTSSGALLSGADGFSATTSGTFEINGTPIAYDVNVDTLTTLAANINAAAIPGLTASVASEGSGKFLRLDSTTGSITVGSDTGDLLSVMDIAGDPDRIDTADIDGTSDSMTLSNRTLTATDETGGEGLKFYYTGSGSTSIDIDFTIGVGAQMFALLEGALDSTDGQIQGEIAAIEGQDKVSNDRIDGMNLRLEIQRTILLNKYAAMEAALNSLSVVEDSIKQMTDAWFGQRN
ncbi:MAG: flagellar filament capping protein FliD [Alphaproteobacteria bacterium]